MARLVAVAGAVVLLVVAAVPLSSGLPDPRQNDAGYGIDAPEAKQAALPLGPGTYQGNITSHYDPVDQYLLDAPPGTVVRVRIQAETIDEDAPKPRIAAMAELESRIGRNLVHDGSYLGNGTWQWNVTAGAGHRVNLSVLPRVYQEPAELIPYTFTVIFDQYDHARLLDGGGRNASAWRIRVPDGVPARFEGFGSTPGPFLDADKDNHVSLTVMRTPWGCHGAAGRMFWGTWPTPGPLFTRSGLGGDDVVWTHGLPRDVHGGPPVQAYDGVPIGSMIFHREIGREEGNFTVLYGHGVSRPMGALGWVVWDGPVAPEIEPLYARARFATLEEFDDGGGQAVQVGPYVTAENVSLSWTVPDREDHTVHLLVDGTTPKQAYIQTGRDDARMRVEKPDGTTVTLEDAWRVWATGGDRIFQGVGPAQSGTWQVRAEHVDGAEGDTIRAHIIEFGFDPGCPEEEPSADAADGAGGGPASGAAPGCDLVCGIAGALMGVLEPLLDRLSFLPLTGS